MHIFALVLVLIFSIPLIAQSGRVVPGTETSAITNQDSPSVKQLFEETSNYLRTKAAEFEAKKIPFTDKRLEQLKIEQRQLAARYAATASLRKDLAGEDLYFTGMLHWIAENFDGTVQFLQKFIAADVESDRKQPARSIAAVSFAKLKNLEQAEKILAEYLANEPQKLTERSRVEGELAKAYKDANKYAQMAPHAEEAYKAAKALLANPASRARGLDEILDSGLLVFEAYRGVGDQNKADAALDDLRLTAINTQTASFAYYVVDKKITYMIETGRKPQALELYQSAILSADKDFPAKPQRDDVVRRLKARDKHYRLLGEAAITFPLVDQWFPGTPKTFADLKGKVTKISPRNLSVMMSFAG